MSEKITTLSKVVDFLKKLQSAGISYELAAHIPRALSVKVTVPGERWEIEFYEDGQVAVEVFKSQGVRGPELLPELFERWSD